MSLVIGDNFSFLGSKPLDGRLKYDTLANMKAVADSTMYDGCLAYCVATDKTYQWKSTNTVDTNTGRWREFESGGSGGTSDYSDLENKPQVNSVTLSGNKTSADLGLQDQIQFASFPQANENLVGKIYQSLNSYTKGLFFECVADGNTYSWKRVNLKDIPVETHYETSSTAGFNFEYYLKRFLTNSDYWEGMLLFCVYGELPMQPSHYPNNNGGSYVCEISGYNQQNNRYHAHITCYNYYNSTVYTYYADLTYNATNDTWSDLTWQNGGLSDYTDLSNKPSINSVTLDGNKTSANLGLYGTGDTAFTELADADYVPVYDSSASASKKSTWSNIKSVLKTYFDTLYNKVTAGTGLSLSNTGEMSIKEFESGDMDDVIPELPQGNTMVSIANAFNRGDIYSTSEKMIGQWQDGKPLYQKTINFGTLPNATAKTVAHGISNLGYVVKVEGTCYNPPTSQYAPLPLPFDIGAQYSARDITVIVDATTVMANTGYNWSSMTTCYITIQYTKSTDSAIAIGEETEYSTSEKIVGTWIDGSKVYQKTVNFGTLPNATSKSVAHGISNLSLVVNTIAIVSNGTYRGNLPYVGVSNINQTMNITCNATNIVIATGTDRTDYSAYVTLQYTKTT